MNLQTMAPNAKRSLLLTTVFGVIAAAFYFGGVKPTGTKLEKARKAFVTTKDLHRKQATDLAGAETVEKRIAETEAKLEPFRKAMLVPLLESTAMRAKSELDPLALGAGLTDVEYEALEPLALPVPKGTLPVQLHARGPIRIVAQGSYQAAVSFLLRVEKEFPLVILQALAITVQSDPDRQRIEMTLEWPVKGAVTRK